MDLNLKCELAAKIIEASCKIYAPKRTGNLAYNAINTICKNGIYYVVIGGEIAPYAVYTNKKWVIGHNPNEGWIQNAIDAVRSALVGLFTDTYTQEEIESYLLKLEKSKTIKLRNLGKGVITSGVEHIIR